MGASDFAERIVIGMNYPQELLDYWADTNARVTSGEAQEWPASKETVSRYKRHLEKLKPIADAGNDLAKYAIASIYHLELIYPDEATLEQRYSEDRATMTQLLFQCAENGMVIAFDNRVTSGVGEIADSARAAAREYDRIQKPDWDEPCNMPVYTPQWMEGAMNLWRTRLREQEGGHDDSS